jgi:hypothetical protein
VFGVPCPRRTGRHHYDTNVIVTIYT